MTAHTKPKIRAANPSDLPDIERIATASPTAPQWTQAQFREALAPSISEAVRRTVLCAEIGEQTVGFAVVSALVSVYPVEAELESIAVHPEHRSHGAGRALLLAAGRWAAALEPANPTLLRLEVRVSNVQALRLYSQNDFAQTAVRPAYYTNPVEDAVCMERTIPQKDAVRDL